MPSVYRKAGLLAPAQAFSIKLSASMHTGHFTMLSWCQGGLMSVGAEDRRRAFLAVESGLEGLSTQALRSRLLPSNVNVERTYESFSNMSWHPLTSLASINSIRSTMNVLRRSSSASVAGVSRTLDTTTNANCTPPLRGGAHL